MRNGSFKLKYFIDSRQNFLFLLSGKLYHIVLFPSNLILLLLSGPVNQQTAFNGPEGPPSLP